MRRRRWSNVEVAQGDAADYLAPEPLDGVLFGLSYNTMPHHLVVLQRALQQLRPGGRLVIMDGKVPAGRGGKLTLPFGLWLMRHTMLGNPLIKPWQDLAAVVDDFEMEEFLFGSWYVCWGTKSARAQVEASRTRPQQLIAAGVTARLTHSACYARCRDHRPEITVESA